MECVVVQICASRHGLELEVYGTFDSMKSAIKFRDKSEATDRKVHKVVVLELCSPHV